MIFVCPFQLRMPYDSTNKGQKTAVVGKRLFMFIIEGFVVIIEGLVCVQPSLGCTLAVPRHPRTVLGDQPEFPSPPGCPGRVPLLPFPRWGQFVVSLIHGKQLPLASSCAGRVAVTSRRLSPRAGDQLRVPRLLGWRVSKQASLMRGLCGQTSCRVPAASQRQLALPGLVDFLPGNGKGRRERGVFGERGPQHEFSRCCGVEKALLGARAWGGWAPWPCLTPLPSAAAAAASAHFSFCRSLLEHTVSAENLSYRLQRNPGSSLTWHDGRSQRPDGGRPVKLLRQPGTEGSQVPPHPPRARQGHAAPGVCQTMDPPQQRCLLFPCTIRPSGPVLLKVLVIIGRLVRVICINIIVCFHQAAGFAGVSSVCRLPSVCHLPSVHHLPSHLELGLNIILH